MIMPRQTSSILNIVVQENLKWVRVWLLVSWAFDNYGILIRLIGVAKMKDHGPSFGVECCDLAVAEADGVDFGCAVDVVLDHFLEMDVSKDDVDEAWLDVPWRVEDYGVFASHCEGVLD